METVNPFPSAGPEPPVRIPTTQELYDFLNQFLAQWLKLASQKIDRVEDDIHPLPNERGLMFGEPTTGILVLRTSEDFGKALEKLAGEKGSSNDLFVEMIVLLWHRFVSKFWNLDSRRMPPALFKKSVPAHWPDRKPDAAVMVMTTRQPIELRLWVDLTPAERERWKSPKK
jgi:hypothetical protein